MGRTPRVKVHLTANNRDPKAVLGPPFPVPVPQSGKEQEKSPMSPDFSVESRKILHMGA